ncbi:MAG TPA: helical backbone metal receptor [Anaerolineaceae bacterium]|nr:helical backbone metal receptor [Anaerolineaceae bacterium]
MNPIAQGGNGHYWLPVSTKPPRRVVSLVPSLTESLIDLGFGDTLVGITDFCLPDQKFTFSIPRVGGPQNARMNDILRLDPDLVIANREENHKDLIEDLERNGVPVWVTFPKTVLQSLDVLWNMIRIFQDDRAADRIRTIEITLEWELASLDEVVEKRYFCPIWQEETAEGRPWFMTFNQDTYSADLLALLGGKNVFAARSRRYPLRADLDMETPEDPGQRDTRYPRVTVEEVLTACPEMILLPDEPYPYGQGHQEEISRIFAATPAARNHHIFTIDGRLITWFGTYLARALIELPPLFA